MATGEESSESSGMKDEEEDNIYEVEKIVGSMKVKGKMMYKVRWVGYNADHDTYEPFENLSSCQEMVFEYLKKQENRKDCKTFMPQAEDQDDATAETSGLSRAQGDRKRQKQPMWKYVNTEEDEYDTLKDKFWRDLDQGKINVFESGDMYSKVKSSGGRAARVQTTKDEGMEVAGDEQCRSTAKRGRGKSSRNNQPKRRKATHSKSTESREGSSTPRSTDTSESSNQSSEAFSEKMQSEEESYSKDAVMCMDEDESRSTSDNKNSVEMMRFVPSPLREQARSPTPDEEADHMAQDCHIEMKEDIVGVLPMSVISSHASSQQENMNNNNRQDKNPTHDTRETMIGNCGETGDEEYEFDFEEIFDPSLFPKEKQMIQKRPMPHVYELTNAELRQAVRSNDYNRLQRVPFSRKTNDMEQPDAHGVTLAMTAAEHGFDDVLELLVLRGANVNAEQKYGLSPLIIACEQGKRCTAALLLKMGAKVNHYTHTGETALTKAVSRGHKSIVKDLLDHGANLASPYNVDMAIKFGKPRVDIMDLINTYAARLKADFEHQVHITLNNTAKLTRPLFPIQCFALRDTGKRQVIFKHELEPTRPGVGMLLFIAHARVTVHDVACRLYGPCAVTGAVLNGVQLGSLTEEGNFVMSLCPLHNGRNELEIQTVRSLKSKTKLIVGAYKAELVS